ncbi:MAG: hypothetical protein HXY41_06015 [Chloroflexi bacterium]|nr:hypothetical protein [Chloroflexota bacterium]
MKLQDNLTDLHYAYMDMVRHWHPGSEPYAGGDALFTALENGWDVSTTVRYEEYGYTGMRFVLIYYFELTRGDERMVMPVIRNPFVNRLVREMPAELVPVEAAAVQRRRPANSATTS